MFITSCRERPPVLRDHIIKRSLYTVFSVYFPSSPGLLLVTHVILAVLDPFLAPCSPFLDLVPHTRPHLHHREGPGPHRWIQTESLFQVLHWESEPDATQGKTPTTNGNHRTISIALFHFIFVLHVLPFRRDNDCVDGIYKCKLRTQFKCYLRRELHWKSCVIIY